MVAGLWVLSFPLSDLSEAQERVLYTGEAGAVGVNATFFSDGSPKTMKRRRGAKGTEERPTLVLLGPLHTCGDHSSSAEAPALPNPPSPEAQWVENSKWLSFQSDLQPNRSSCPVPL